MRSTSFRRVLDLWAFVLPIFILYTLFFTYPLVGTVVYSFTDWNGISKTLNFVGFTEYLNAFKDGGFLHSMVFTFVYTGIFIVAINVFALATALALTSDVKGRNSFRALIFFPYVLNIVSVGFIFSFIFGKLMIGLSEATNFWLFEVGWLTDTPTVIFSIVLVQIWVSLGYYMVIYIAGVGAIPSEILEAALVDGAVGWKRFWSVTLPLLMPAVTVSLFVGLISSLRIFALLLTLTQGGPGSYTESILYNIYLESFTGNHYGFAAAKSVIFLLIVMLITFVQLRITKTREVRL